LVDMAAALLDLENLKRQTSWGPTWPASTSSKYNSLSSSISDQIWTVIHSRCFTRCQKPPVFCIVGGSSTPHMDPTMDGKMRIAKIFAGASCKSFKPSC
jgi:hypothetical protein